MAAATMLLAEVKTSTRPHTAALLSLSMNGVPTSESIDPNRLSNPASYDTRPCEKAPSQATCNGKYPVTPATVPVPVGIQQGAGACMNGESRVIESQDLTDRSGHVGTLQLRWLPLCGSYSSRLSLAVSPDQIETLSIWTQTERYGWFEQFSGLPPFPTGIEQTGPVSGSNLPSQELSSPLIFSPSDPVSATIHLELTNGSIYGNFTSSYSFGVKQYSA
jgi:hypothetical protein